MSTFKKGLSGENFGKINGALFLVVFGMVIGVLVVFIARLAGALPS